MERRLLSEDEIASRLKELDGWTAEDDKLKRQYKFANFSESLAFVNRVGEIAEAADHHPDITFGWGYAEIATTTHDRGGITDVDFLLAAQINQL
jgi:4a-hydroxytetrahydrobiopterin dehydratase